MTAISTSMLAAGLVLVAGAFPARAGESVEASRIAAIDAAAAHEMARSGSPSVQIAVAFDGQPTLERAYGRANLEHDIPAMPNTRYRTASVAKWMTATAALILVEQGALDLDAPVQRYCPQFPEKSSPITTRQLITHTSGLGYDPDYEAEFAAAGSDTERLEIERRRHREILGRFTRYDSTAEALDNFKHEPLLFEPGTRWSYASTGYRVLGCVLEGAAGRPYRELMREIVFAPAGMSSTVPDDAWAIVPHRAGLYQVINQDLELRHADYRDVSENLPAGGYLSTAGDLVKFLRRFLSGGYLDADSRALMVRPIADAAMVRNGSASSLPVEVPYGPRYGYGVMLFPTDEGVWLGHTGRQDGASSIMVASPDGKCVAAVLLNVRSWVGGFDFARKICRAASPAS